MTTAKIAMLIKPLDLATTENDKIVKRIFDDAAGKRYMRFAYDPTYRLARQLFRYGTYLY